MHRRPAGKSYAGLWEFPGGKIDPGESPRAALKREIAEECGLALDADAMREVGFAADEPGEEPVARPILLLLIACSRWEGEARSLEGGEWRWCAPAEIAKLAKPLLDARLAAQFFG